MNKQQREKIEKKERRRIRVRAKILGTAKRPRLNVFRSLKHIYVQLIDDVNGKTLVGADDREISDISDNKDFHCPDYKGKVKAGYAVGWLAAKKALEKGIAQVVFDKASYKYHGRVKAVAEGARRGGLKF